MMGLEPTAPRATIWCSNHLSYTHRINKKVNNIVARLVGFEPTTHGLEVRCSIP